MEFLAHIATQGETFKLQRLEDHLANTALIAKKFSNEFGNENWGYLMGIWHDIGKYALEFQHYMAVNSGYKDGVHVGPKVDHSSAGAIHAVTNFGKMGIPIAYAIAGHHAGLLNWYPEAGCSGDLESRLDKKELYDSVKHLIDSEGLPPLNPPFGNGKVAAEDFHLWIRMLYSCLVDADYLETESFMNEEASRARGQYANLEELQLIFKTYLDQMLAAATPSKVNSVRKKILENCISSGSLKPGFFSITVPPGGGKTLSSMAWALEHANTNSKRRIIFVIPYTTIITQTAEVYRRIFGAENVVEHHSNLAEDNLTPKAKLAIENWDAPIVVTTNVQFFESFYSNRPSSCRKLHNVANSIIIFDEAQMLPPEFLKPILSLLKSLTQNYGVSVLLSTATQPALEGVIGVGANAFRGIEAESVREIAGDVALWGEELKRVELELPVDINTPTPYTHIAEELSMLKQVLCIVNTRNECKKLFKLLPEGTIHLSRMMCTAHIMDKIALIKQKLNDNETVRVVSTQLIEAGVDVDFPNVYRALAGLDSIAQSAGRNNREGKLERLGKTKVFVGEMAPPPGLMRKGADATKEVAFLAKSSSLLVPDKYKAYFDLLYAKYSKVGDFDKAKIKENLWDGASLMRFQFATAAANFKLIDDKGAKSIAVRYGKGTDLIEALKRNGPTPALFRKLQQYTVSVSEKDFNGFVHDGAIESIHGVWVQSNALLYNLESGLNRQDDWCEEILIA